MTKILAGLTMIASLTAAPQGMTQAQMSQMMQPQACPMKVTGADIATADTKDGVAITFTAKSAENVAEVQKRVEQMSKMHDSMSGMPMMQGTTPMAAFTSKYEKSKEGARLTLTPKNPADLKEFRTRVAAHVDQMKKGDCSSMMEQMMGGMTGGMMNGTAPPKTK